MKLNVLVVLSNGMVRGSVTSNDDSLLLWKNWRYETTIENLLQVVGLEGGY